eukprot:3048192-Prymnesium_polylepis.1
MPRGLRHCVSSCCWRYGERPKMPSGCSPNRATECDYLRLYQAHSVDAVNIESANERRETTVDCRDASDVRMPTRRPGRGMPH